jgi:N-acetylmuramoyl-L-alanine amidase
MYEKRKKYSSFLWGLTQNSAVKFGCTVFVGAILMCFMPAAKFPARKIDKIQTIVLDAGHGGDDTGAPGIKGNREFLEKEVTLDLALRLGKIIEEKMPEVRVLYTRKSDKSVKLWERPNFANRNEADLFISIHCNANNNPKAHGSETYFMGLHVNDGNLDVAKRENAAITYEADYRNNDRYGGFDPNSPESHIIFSLVQNAYINQSLRLSSYVETETGKISQIRSRGVKQAGFLVLWKTSMPSILVETGFITNPEDRKYLASDEGKNTIANGIFKAIENYKNFVEKTP